MNKTLKIAVLTISMATLSVGVQAFGLKDISSNKSSSESVDTGDLVERQSGIVENLVAGLKEYTGGQAQVAHALGLKEEAEKLESEQDALASGNVKDESSISKTMKVSSSAQEAIDKKMAESGALSSEAKQEFAKALPLYAKGTANTYKMLPEVQSWAGSAGSAIKNSGLMGASTLKKKLATGLFVASELPDYLGTAKNSYGSLIAFAKKNEIDTSQAEDLLGDDF